MVIEPGDFMASDHTRSDVSPGGAMQRPRTLGWTVYSPMLTEASVYEVKHDCRW